MEQLALKLVEHSVLALVCMALLFMAYKFGAALMARQHRNEKMMTSALQGNTAALCALCEILDCWRPSGEKSLSRQLRESGHLSQPVATQNEDGDR